MRSPSSQLAAGVVGASHQNDANGSNSLLRLSQRVTPANRGGIRVALHRRRISNATFRARCFVVHTKHYCAHEWLKGLELGGLSNYVKANRGGRDHSLTHSHTITHSHTHTQGAFASVNAGAFALYIGGEFQTQRFVLGNIIAPMNVSKS